MKAILRHEDKSIFCSITFDNTTFYNSCKVKSSEEMNIWIDEARKIADKSFINCTDKVSICVRSKKSMIREWKAHNLLYKLGIEKDRTRNVDLNINQKWYVNWAYFLLSCLYFY